jgi:hypothetical protein
MKKKIILLKKVLCKEHPTGDLPFFLTIFLFMLTMLAAVSQKSGYLLRVSLLLALIAFFYATVWLSLRNHYLSKELEKTRKRFSLDNQ